MVDSTKGALEFLEQLRGERDELNIIIAALEKRLGISSSPVEDTANGSASTQSAPAKPRVSIRLDSIPVGFFHNMSQADAAEKLLRLSPGQALSTNEILEAFRKAGMQLNPKNAVTILYTTLKRSPKFERVAGKAWGLSEWYPERRRKKEEEIEDLAG